MALSMVVVVVVLMLGLLFGQRWVCLGQSPQGAKWFQAQQRSQAGQFPCNIPGVNLS
jgi:hypothetical protein